MRNFINIVESNVINFNTKNGDQDDRIGYQIGDNDGYSIQGEEDDPTGLPDYVVLDDSAVAYLRKQFPELTFVPIYLQDIGEFVLANEKQLRDYLHG